MQVAAELVKNGEVSLLHWWIYAITIMAVLFTSAVSLAKPMRIAAKVSPIEAMRYQGLEKTWEKSTERLSESHDFSFDKSKYGKK